MRSHFSMYCSLNAISGYEQEKERAAAILSKNLAGKPGIVIFALEDDKWIYGQATFRYPEDGEEPLKFMDLFSTLASNGALGVLTATGGPDAILFTDAKTKARFEAHAAFADVRSLFRLVTSFQAPQPQKGLFTGLKGWLRKVKPVAPERPIDEGELARESMELYEGRIREGSDLIETLHCGVGYYHFCALDRFLEVLRARAAEWPEDADGQTALGIVLTDFGDHAAALQQAATASGLDGSPPEAALWHAKAAWWQGEWNDGLGAMERIGPFPDHWTTDFRSSVEALRSALLAGAGDLEGSIKALRNALDLDGSSVAMNLRLGRLLCEAGRAGEAVQAIRTSRVIDPAEPMFQVEFCRALDQQGDVDALEKALGRLSGTERGRIEARRFEPRARVDDTIARLLPGSFEDFDRQRDRCVTAATLPDWMTLVADSTLFTVMNVYLAHEHRLETEHARMLAFGFRRLFGSPLDAEAHISLAATWAQCGRRDIAVQWARNAVSFAPENDLNHWMLANSLKESGDLDQAFEAAEFAQSIGKADEDALVIIHDLLWTIPRLDRFALMIALSDESRLSLRKSAEERLDDPRFRPGALFVKSLTLLPDNYDQAVALQREALDLRPDDDALHDHHIATLEDGGDPAAVETARATQGAALTRRLPEVTSEDHADIADALLAEGRVAAARKFAQAAKHLDPALPRLQLIFGDLAIASGNLDEAIAELETLAWSNEALAARAADKLATALSEADRCDEALTFWRRLQDLEPNNAKGHHRAAIDLWLAERDAEALPSIERALQLDPSDPHAWNLYGRMLKLADRKEEALSAFNKALSFGDPPIRAELNRARLLIGLGRQDEALANCDDILLRDPANWEAVIGRIEVLGDKGLKNLAERAASDWIASGSPDAKSTLEVQQALYDAAGVEAAARLGDTSVGLHPEDGAILADQAYNLTSLARFDEATELARKALQSATLSSSGLKSCAYALGMGKDVDSHEAATLIDRLLSFSRDAKSLRYAANVQRAASIDATAMFVEARNAYEAAPERDDALIAWCMTNAGELEAASKTFRLHLISNPHDDSSRLDAAITDFLRSKGGNAASGALDAQLRDAKSGEHGILNLRFAERVVQQWIKQRTVASQRQLEELEVVLNQVLDG